MKTKNFLRVFFAAFFVLGAITMDAQTKFYVFKDEVVIDEYNIADVDSISLTAPSGAQNLLTNPGFDTHTSNLPNGWTRVPEEWFIDFYDAAQGTFTWATSDPQQTPTGFFNNNSNGCALNSVKDQIFFGTLAVRCGQNSTAIYQLVDVDPVGKTYSYGITFAYRCMEEWQSFGSNQTLKILSDDGETVYGQTPLVPSATTTDDSFCNTTKGFEIGLPTNVTGTVTIPAGVEQVRFQIGQFQLNVGLNSGSPIFIFDEAFFMEAE